MGIMGIPDFEKINIRGVDFANVTMDETVEIAKSFINDAENKTHVIYTPNAEITQSCIDDKTGALFEIINSADMVIPDGSGIVLASKILKTPLKQKVGGYDFGCNNLIPYLDEIGGTLFLLGSQEETVKKAAANLNEQYKNLKVFEHHGYFDFTETKNQEDNQKVIDKINESQADVVFVCFGGPASEKWIYKNKSKINKGILIALGGTVDVIAGVKKYAPKFFIKLNLEWLYYYIKYPVRRKRFKALPRFVFGTMFARKNKKNKNKNKK